MQVNRKHNRCIFCSRCGCKPCCCVGPPGPEGLSAYEIAVLNGFVGTEQQWLASLVGPPGPPGPEGPPGPGAIIPLASGTPAQATTTLGGIANTSSSIGFGFNVPGIIVLGNEINLLDLSNTAFIVPRDSTLEGVFAFFSVTAALALVGSEVTVSVRVFESTTPDNAFTEIAAAATPLTPTLTGLISVGDILTGSTTGIGYPLTAGTRLLVVVSAEVTGGLDIATAVAGQVSAGLDIR